MERADEFLRLYNELTNFLVRLTDAASGTPYQRLLDSASQRNSTVRRLRDRLRIYGYLRNAIVHYSEYPPEIVAEPAEFTIQRLRDAIEELQSPERLVPRFEKGVHCFLSNEPLRSALALMRQKDFSQVIVIKDGEICLLTVEGIAKWLEDEAVDRSVNIEEARVLDALSKDIPDTSTVMSANHTVDDARQVFFEAIALRRPRLYAVIITPAGGRNEAPIGIVTPWDLLQLWTSLEHYGLSPACNNHEIEPEFYKQLNGRTQTCLARAVGHEAVSKLDALLMRAAEEAPSTVAKL